ncbi:ribosomal protein L28e [Trichodelitschia bisporula]|uniref:Ribosomal protein L28e n=1 Tax=Trichodelitschia bisporula TaxID=703511 RepID=A0A6G1I7C0_9PEZI|nr:ribosomal protein L28e [Trichodelitschia bisporula]
MATISSDLLWLLTRNSSSYLVKGRGAAGGQFSSDPLNLNNVHARKYEGFIQDKAVGVTAAEDGSIVVTTKKGGKTQKPASQLQKSTIGKNKSSRETFKAIVGGTAKQGYRVDLRREVVARASAIKSSQRPVRQQPTPKLRGTKAKKAAEASA